MATKNDSNKTLTEALLPEADQPQKDAVVICDECGDSLWDAVLAQEGKQAVLKAVCKLPLVAGSNAVDKQVY